MVKLVAISDTHSQHERVGIPECDILVHAGDFTWEGDFLEVRDFVEWLEQQPAKHKVVIAGNHELSFDQGDYRYHEASRKLLAYNTDQTIHYLEDSGVELEGIKFWGTPWTPVLGYWAFNATTRTDAPFDMRSDPPLLEVKYGMIPKDTDVVICHGPPYGLVDRSTSDDRCGSIEMRNLLENELSNVKLFMSGHIHEARGYTINNDTHVCNVATLARDYVTVRDPVVIYIDDGIVSHVEGY